MTEFRSPIPACEARLADGMARADDAQRAATRATAALWATIRDVLAEARRHPELFLGEAVHHVDTDAAEFAERAAAADLAVRLRLSESTVRTHALRSQTLAERLPSLWTAFCDGALSVSHAQFAAELVATLPESCDPALDEALLAPAIRLSPPRFREVARRIAERLHPVEPEQRHREALTQRRVFLEPAPDGMCWLTAHLGIDAGERIMARLDAAASSLANHVTETRSLAQLRADVAADLLLGTGLLHSTGQAAPGVGVSVGVTVPVLTLLGRSDEPAMLEGRTPIDVETARRLVGEATSITRILTHPITGTVLDIDRTNYRVPRDLKRWTELRDQHCTFPGCGRRARDCDLDHTTAWAHDGPTSAANLAHLCRHHHRLKHESAWQVERDAGGAATWTSPTGYVQATDPPPF